jgi:acetyl esterase/lipase
VYTVDPLDGPTGGHAIYAHGGSWMNTITSQHWRLIAELASRTGTRFTVPIYPLVPFGTADAVVPVFADLAAAAVRDSGSGRTTLMGDSAGGTIALAAAMHLRDKGLAGPAHVVLISPALDLGFSDPAIERIQPTDPWLAVPGLRVAADRWRGDRSIDDPLVSPIRGTLSGIGRIALFSGSHDILHADAQALLRRAGAEGHPIDFHDAPGMLHVYPLLPVPEGRAARTAIAAVLKGARDSA